MSNQFLPEDRIFMRRAIELALQAEVAGEVPVGAVLIKGQAILGKGCNCPIAGHDPTAHAEIIALRAAAQRSRNYRLPGTVMYVTLEPCVMCVGALIHARVERVVFGAPDPKIGAAGSTFNLLQHEAHNHRINVTGGVLEKECSALLTSFFTKKRREAHARA